MQKAKRIGFISFFWAGFVIFVWLLGQTAGVSAEVQCTGDNLVVTNNNSSGAGSLRQAIIDVCAAGTVSFGSGLSGQQIDVFPEGTLLITKTMTIDGRALPQAVTVSGNQMGRVMHIAGTGALTLRNVVIAEGTLSTSGGACQFVCGAGIFVDFDGRLTLVNSTIMSNTAAGGAGLYSFGIVTIANSTFRSNVSMFEGSALRNGGQMTIANSTFSGNTSQAAPGGAIFVGAFSNLTLYHNTIVSNTATTAGGLVNNGSVNMANNIIGNSLAPADCMVNDDPQFPGTIGTNINNLIEDGSCEAVFSGEPYLAPLADNGGPTLTHALRISSPALSAGHNSICGNASVNFLDQRGVARPQDKPCDLGAFELDDSRSYLPLLQLP